MPKPNESAAAAARANAKRIIEDQKKQDKQKRAFITTAISVAALAIIGFVGFLAFQDVQEAKQRASITSAQLTPTLADSSGSFYVSKDGTATKPADDSTAVRVDMFFDPQCPGCGVVERGIGDRIEELVQNGEIDLYMSPVSFLDKASADRYSSRATNAVVTVAEKSPENLLKFVNAIYEKDFQPAEGGKSVSDEKLAEQAVKVGVPETVANEFKNHSYFDWIAANSTTQMDRKDYFAEGFSTPSVFLGSKVQDGVATDYTKVKFADSDVLKTFNETFSNLPKGK